MFVPLWLGIGLSIFFVSTTKLLIFRDIRKSLRPFFIPLSHVILNLRNLNSLKTFVETVKSLKEKQGIQSIADLLEEILQQSGLGDLYRNDGDEERIENINELMNSIRYYEQCNINEDVSLDKYLQDIALFTNSDYNKETETIKLMTIHQSKGLEFPYVFVVGLTEGIFPNHRTIRERKKNGLEEERRLMYVAITRAERALFLTESEGYNYSTKSDKYPSRFITEIGDGLIKLEGYIDPALITGCKKTY